MDNNPESDILQHKLDLIIKSNDGDLFKSFSSDLKSRFPNGNWVTMSGSHVFINDGKVVAGLDSMNKTIDEALSKEKKAKVEKEKLKDNSPTKVTKDTIKKLRESETYRSGLKYHNEALKYKFKSESELEDKALDGTITPNDTFIPDVLDTLFETYDGLLVNGDITKGNHERLKAAKLYALDTLEKKYNISLNKEAILNGDIYGALSGGFNRIGESKPKQLSDDDYARKIVNVQNKVQSMHYEALTSGIEIDHDKLSKLTDKIANLYEVRFGTHKGKNIKHEFTGVDKPTNELKENIDSALNFTALMVGGTSLINKIKPKFNIDNKKNERASCGGFTVNCTNEVSTTTLTHELGHALEHSHPTFGKLSKAFLNKRIGSEQPTPIYACNESEIGVEDGFMDKYMGKIYDHNATEVLSMGMQYLYENPSEFRKKDRDSFNFTHGMLSLMKDMNGKMSNEKFIKKYLAQ